MSQCPSLKLAPKDGAPIRIHEGAIDPDYLADQIAVSLAEVFAGRLIGAFGRMEYGKRLL